MQSALPHRSFDETRSMDAIGFTGSASGFILSKD